MDHFSPAVDLHMRDKSVGPGQKGAGSHVGIFHKTPRFANWRGSAQSITHQRFFEILWCVLQPNLLPCVGTIIAHRSFRKQGPFANWNNHLPNVCKKPKIF